MSAPPSHRHASTVGASTVAAAFSRAAVAAARAHPSAYLFLCSGGGAGATGVLPWTLALDAFAAGAAEPQSQQRQSRRQPPPPVDAAWALRQARRAWALELLAALSAGLLQSLRRARAGVAAAAGALTAVLTDADGVLSDVLTGAADGADDGAAAPRRERAKALAAVRRALWGRGGSELSGGGRPLLAHGSARVPGRRV